MTQTVNYTAGSGSSVQIFTAGTAGTPSVDVMTVQGKAGMTAVVVDPSAVTSPISAASLPLPAGAATAAKQPALGTAGTSSADVITVQGAASMTPVTVGGTTIAVTNTPTITASSAYVAEYLLGNLQTITAARINNGSGLILGAAIADKDKQNCPIDIVFFKANPTNTTFTDHLAFAPNNLDLLQMVGVMHLNDYSTFNANSLGQVNGANIAFNLAGQGGASLWYCLVARGTPTYTTTTSLQVTIKIAQD